MKILIVDDEPLARSRLQDLLSDIGNFDVIGEASNGRQALEMIQALSPDLVLLDIHMPELNGIEVAMHLTHMAQPPAIIFATAYSDHALEAFEANAIDYLLKPIRRARLEQALNKAQPLQPEQISKVAHDSGEGPRRHISATHRGGLKLIPIKDIQYFHADSKYVALHHSDGEVLIDDSLKALEEEFGAYFTRVHRNALVANQHIESLEKMTDGHYQLHLRGTETVLEVSRRQLPHVRKVIAEMGK